MLFRSDVRRNENQIVYTENDYVVKKDDHRRRYYSDDDDFDQPVYLPREGWKNKRDLDWIVIGPKYWFSPVIEIYELRASLDYQVIF